MQALASSQSLALPAHLPVAQESPEVQALLSSQVEVAGKGALTQAPLLVSQLSVVHKLASLQFLLAPDTHLPAAQTSGELQALPSSQGKVLGAYEHLPPEQASLVHRFLSSQSPMLAQLPPQPAMGTNLQPPSPGLHVSLLHTSPSSQTLALPETQLPAAHASPTVQSRPSSQASLLLAWLQPFTASQPSVVQTFLSSQLTGLATHLPPEQTSPEVHAVPSSHTAVLVLDPHLPLLQVSSVQGFLSSQSLTSAQLPPQPKITAVLHAPVLASHESVVHASPSSHTFLVPTSHFLLLHVSPTVQASPSASQVAADERFTQPFKALQVSREHGFLSSQSNAAPGVQVPPWQLSFSVQLELSASHGLPCNGAPSALHWPVAASQPSLVHKLPSSHTLALPATHTLSAQASPTVQAVLSASQGLVLAVNLQPTCGSQASVVHELPSSHTCGWPGAHLPASHWSSWVHALASASHGWPVLIGTRPHLPVSASHLSCAQAPPSALHFTMVLALITHAYGALALSHTNVPLQALPSSLQSASVVHSQVFKPEAHLPAAQLSPVEQALPSSQGKVLAVAVQPVFLSQASVVQGLSSSQSLGSLATPLHLPVVHLSKSEQALPSSQGPALSRNEQPVLTSQLSVVQGLPSSHEMALPAHLLSPHASPEVHRLPSSQATLALSGRWAQAPLAGSQASWLHGLASSQSLTLPPLHAPASHRSPKSQALPSLHGTALGVCTQPVATLHASSVHGLASSQALGLPAHLPFAQVSLSVQMSPSVQVTALGTATQPV